VASSAYCFTVSAGNRSLVLSASCRDEKLLWMQELRSAIRAARHRSDCNTVAEPSVILYPSLKSNSMSC